MTTITNLEAAFADDSITLEEIVSSCGIEATTKQTLILAYFNYKYASSGSGSPSSGGDTPIAGTYTTVTATSVAGDLITGSLNGSTTLVQIQPEQDIRVKSDGTDPTSGDGFLIQAGTLVNLTAAEANALRIIREGGADVVVNIQEYQ